MRNKQLRLTLTELLVLLGILCIVLATMVNVGQFLFSDTHKYDWRTGTTTWTDESGDKYIKDQNGNVRPVPRRNETK